MQSINQSANQSINQPINQSINQSINRHHHLFVAQKQHMKDIKH